MKNKRIAYLFALLFLIGGLIQNAFAQQGQVSFSNGIAVSIKTEQNGESKDLSNIYTSSSSDKNVVRRVMIDRKSKIFFGYDLEINWTAETNQIEVSINPLSVKEVSDVISKTGGLSDLSLRSLPKYPGKITIQSGDTVVLDLLENPQTKQKISDSIKITQGNQKTFTYVSNGGNPKDFTVNNIQMSLNGFETYVNGEKMKFGSGGMSGSVMWVYFPNKGRFIFSPIEQSNPGFKKIGLIDDKTITFDYEGANYQFVSNNPILAGGGKWNLWVMYDENYNSSSESNRKTTFSFGAADKVEYLFDNK